MFFVSSAEVPIISAPIHISLDVLRHTCFWKVLFRCPVPSRSSLPQSELWFLFAGQSRQHLLSSLITRARSVHVLRLVRTSLCFRYFFILARAHTLLVRPEPDKIANATTTALRPPLMRPFTEPTAVVIRALSMRNTRKTTLSGPSPDRVIIPRNVSPHR